MTGTEASLCCSDPESWTKPRPRLLPRSGVRYSQTSSIEDLEQAITYTQEAVAATPLDHPNRATYLNNLGSRFCDRYNRTCDDKDQQRSLQVFQDGVNCSTSLLLPRVYSGRNAIQIFHQRHSWEDAAVVTETLFGLLPRLCGRYLSHDDQQHVLKQVSGLAADACSLSLKLNDPHQALQRVEFGRALILGYLVDGRSDISELVLAYPALAREYEELRSRAVGTSNRLEDNTNRESRLRKQRMVPQLLDDCERRIRDKPGLEHFQRLSPNSCTPRKTAPSSSLTAQISVQMQLSCSHQPSKLSHCLVCF